jgi:diguanylate cyclase (GGDEF)-like protein/PAS domain S-box-containing protein
MKEVIDAIAIATGAALMWLGIRRAWSMRSAVQQAGYCTLLKVLLGLMHFFLIGYLFSLWAIITHHTVWLHSIVAFVFLFGSVFVLLTLWLAQRTTAQILHYSQHLEGLVQERTEHLHQALRQQEQLKRYFEQLFEGMPVACFTYDRDGVIREWNQEAEKLYGFTAPEVVGKTIYETFCRPEDVETTRAVIARVFGGEAVRNIEWQHRTKDGTTKWVLCSTFPLVDTDGQVVGAISANIDITERKAQEQLIEAQRDELEAQNDQLQQVTARLAEANARLERIAHTDGLTGLINHRSFRDRLGREFFYALRREQPLSVVLLDVDHFKQFNDTFGHQAGDEVLRLVANTLRQFDDNLRCAARYGGEEFVVLLPGSDVHESLDFAEQIRQRISEIPCCYRQITASLGVSTLDQHTVNPDTLIEEADQALYLSKRAGRNRVTHAAHQGIHVNTLSEEEWLSRLQQVLGDPGGFAEQQVFAQLMYDVLQTRRRALHEGCQQVCSSAPCRLHLWQQMVGEPLYGETDAFRQLLESHETMHRLLREGTADLQQLDHACEQMLDSLQQLRALCDIRHQRAA